MRGKGSNERILKKKIVAENGPILVGDILTELRNSVNFKQSNFFKKLHSIGPLNSIS